MNRAAGTGTVTGAFAGTPAGATAGTGTGRALPSPSTGGNSSPAEASTFGAALAAALSGPSGRMDSSQARPSSEPAQGSSGAWFRPDLRTVSEGAASVRLSDEAALPEEAEPEAGAALALPPAGVETEASPAVAPVPPAPESAAVLPGGVTGAEPAGSAVRQSGPWDEAAPAAEPEPAVTPGAAASGAAASSGTGIPSGNDAVAGVGPSAGSTAAAAPAARSAAVTAAAQDGSPTVGPAGFSPAGSGEAGRPLPHPEPDGALRAGSGAGGGVSGGDGAEAGIGQPAATRGAAVSAGFAPTPPASWAARSGTPAAPGADASASGQAASTSAFHLPGGVPTPPTLQPAPTLPVQPAPAPPALLAQVQEPIVRLARSSTGEHALVLKVSPENLGPLTVRALMGPDGLRIELFAPNDAGRDAVRAILGDLRRDLAGAGVQAGLTLSQHNRPDAQDVPTPGGDTGGDGHGRRAFDERQARSRNTSSVSGAETLTPSLPEAGARDPRNRPPRAGIDVLA